MKRTDLHLTLLAAAYLISGAILIAADAISRGGSYCGVVGTVLGGVGILLSVRSPLQRMLAFLFKSDDPS